MWPLALYHLAAPGVVLSACAPAGTSTVMSSVSPPAIPPGGWISTQWQIPGPSG